MTSVFFVCLFVFVFVFFCKVTETPLVQQLLQYFKLHLIQPESNQIKKLQQTPCKEQQRQAILFNRLPYLWNSLPPIDCSSPQLLMDIFWDSFSTRFNPDNYCSIHVHALDAFLSLNPASPIATCDHSLNKICHFFHVSCVISISQLDLSGCYSFIVAVLQLSAVKQ